MTTPPVTFLARDAAANTFTLSINGQEHTYPATKDGKRQAIVDSLQAIPLLEVGDKTYLPSNLALEAVAVVMYPNGIPNEAAFRTLTDVTEKACAHIGYGEEVELAPPHVPFTARGSYRLQFAPISLDLIRDELAQVRLSFGAPCYEVAGAIVWNHVAQERHKKLLGQLPDGQQKAIATQVDALVTQLNWHIESRGTEAWYVRQAIPDLAQARQKGGAYLARMEGLVCPADYLREQLLLGAYGRRYYITDIGPELQVLFAELLVEYGYSCSPGDDQLRPRPVDIPTAQESILHEALTQLTPVLTPQGPVLRVSDILRTIQQTLAIPPLVHWRVQRVLSENPIAGWLQQMGYQTEMTSVRGDQLQPPGERGQNEQVLLKTIRVKQDNNKRLTLADKLSVLAPVLTIDDGEKSLVYLEMVGAKQSVKANWAALVGGGKYHYVDGHTIILDGMKRHVRLQKTLPCGWVDWILLHKQASLKEMNPDQPFYLLDDGTQPIPPMFYPMLNRCLAVPVLPEWSTYLWICGRERELITLLDKGEGQGYAAWKVTTAGVIMSTAYFLPYGGYRYPSTPPPSELTDTGFTGHKHNDSIGLIYMNARYYIPYLNRFLTADTLVPGPTNPQAFNRYSYVLGNPLILVDPSGHGQCNGDESCQDEPYQPTTPPLPNLVEFTGDGWTDAEKATINQAAMTIAIAYARVLNERNRALGLPLISVRQAFLAVHGGSVEFKRVTTSCSIGCYGERTGKGEITVYSNANGHIEGNVMWAMHEIFHDFNANAIPEGEDEGRPYVDLGLKPVIVKGEIISPFEGSSRTLAGYRLGEGGVGDRTPYVNSWQDDKVREDFADMGANWAANSFAANSSGIARYNWMETRMLGYIDLAIAHNQ